MPIMNDTSLRASDIIWETPVCASCGSAERRHVITSFDYEISIECEFTIVECADCGLCYTCPRPEIRQLIENFYPDDYICYIHADENATMGRLDSFFDMRTNGPRYRRLARFANGRSISLLDVGCGDGYLLKHLKRRTDWQLRGLEPNPKMASYLNRQGLEVDCGLLHEMNYEDASFDAVILTHVLEHTPDPLAVLQEISRIMRPGGMLLVEVPNFNAFGRNLMKRYWWGYHLPRHLYHFTPQTLSALASKAGLVRTGLRYPFLFGSWAWNIHIMLKMSRAPMILAEALTYRHPLLLMSGAPLELINVVLRRGNLMELCFEKQKRA